MSGRWVAGVVMVAVALGGAPSRTHAQDAVERVTVTGARNGQPFLSPDGSRLAFVSDREDGWQVWLADADGGDPRRLTRESEPVGWPSWTADGSAILFYGRRDGAYRLLRTSPPAGLVDPVDVDGLIAFRPLVSPDGRLLLFDAVDPGGPEGHDLYVREIDSGRQRRLTRDPGYDSDGRWSPDGRRVVFHSDRGQAPLHVQVHVVSLDGGAPRQLTRGPARNGYPAWSPDGRCIVYTSETDGNRDLWVMDADGGDRRRLTRHQGMDTEPVWVSGGRVLFATDRFGGMELAYLQVPPEVVGDCEGGA